MENKQTEYEASLAAIQGTLQKTASEQNALEGGKKRTPYTFTREDAINAIGDWGAQGASPDNDILPVVRKNKTHLLSLQNYLLLRQK